MSDEEFEDSSESINLNLSQQSSISTDSILENIRRSNIKTTTKNAITEQIKHLVYQKKQFEEYREQRQTAEFRLIQTRTNQGSAQQSTQQSTSRGQPIFRPIFFTSTPITRSSRTRSNPDLTASATPIVRKQKRTRTPSPNYRFNMAQGNLTQADITQITDIVTQNVHQNDGQMRKFHGSPSDAVSWLEDFEYQARANGWNDDKKKQKMCAHLTGAGREWYSLEVEGTQKNWDQTKDSFYNQFLPIGYEAHLKQEFRTRKQQLFEPAANFIASMRSLLQRSNQNMQEREAVDFILRNMQPQLVERIMPLNPTNYDDLKKFANLVEQGMKASIEGEKKILALTETINQLSLTNQSQWTPNRGENSRSRPPKRYSRDFNSRTREGRPKCYFCGIPGHIQVNCRKRMRSQQGNSSRNFNQSSRGRGYRNRGNFNNANRRFYNNRNFRNGNNRNGNAGMIGNNQREAEQEVRILNIIGAIGINNGFFINVSINGQSIEAIVDTGAAACFMNENFAKINGFFIQEWKGKTYTLANGQQVKPIGETKVTMTVSLNGQTKSAELSIYVLKGLTANVVIGSNIIRAMKMVINGGEGRVSF